MKKQDTSSSPRILPRTFLISYFFSTKATPLLRLNGSINFIWFISEVCTCGIIQHTLFGYQCCCVAVVCLYYYLVSLVLLLVWLTCFIYDWYVYCFHLMNIMLKRIYLTHLSWAKGTCSYNGYKRKYKAVHYWL